MITAEIDKNDLRELQRDLHVLRPENLLKSELSPFAVGVIKETGMYPPSVGYPRTGHLGRSWSHVIHKRGVDIVNAATYAGWVHGEEQVSFHAVHGWKQLTKVALSHIDKLIKRLEAKVERIWKH